METALEAKLLSILAISAVALLVVVTGGIVYLTLVEWRDRRRKSRADLDSLPRRRNAKAQARQGKASKASKTKSKASKTQAKATKK